MKGVGCQRLEIGLVWRQPAGAMFGQPKFSSKTDLQTLWRLATVCNPTFFSGVAKLSFIEISCFLKRRDLRGQLSGIISYCSPQAKKKRSKNLIDQLLIDLERLIDLSRLTINILPIGTAIVRVIYSSWIHEVSMNPFSCEELKVHFPRTKWWLKERTFAHLLFYSPSQRGGFGENISNYCF